MTEEEWLECTDPMTMLKFLRGKASKRKLRLFACGCCRQVWHLLKNLRSRQAVEMSERFADGFIKMKELHRATRNAEAVEASIAPKWIGMMMSRDYAAARAAIGASLKDKDLQWAISGIANEIRTELISAHEQATVMVEKVSQAAALHCIFGNPFRPITIDPRWLTSTVVDLANTIYTDRAFDRMPLLADALMDAGCDNEEMIAHCRSDGVHVRGCFVVDLLLGKA